MNTRLKLNIAALALLLGATLVRADAKIEVLPAGDVYKTKGYNLSLKNVSIPEMIDGFRKQTGIPVEMANAERATGGPAVIGDLEIKDVDLYTAVDALGRAVGMGVSSDGGDSRPTFRLYPDGNGLNDRQRLRGGAAASAKLSSINRNATDPPNPNNAEPVLSVTFQVAAGPTPMLGGGVVEWDEVIDDAGRPMKAPAQGRNTVSWGTGMVNAGASTGAQGQLVLSNPAPKSIKSLRAAVVVQRPKTVRRITFTDFAEAPAVVELDGAKMTIGPVAKGGAAGELMIRLDRGSMAEAQWQQFRNSIAADQAVVTSDTGEPLRLMGRGGTTSSAYSENRYTVRPERRAFEAVKPDEVPPKPVRLVLDTITETTPERLPVEAADLPIP
ncbi:MAG TPA: hypothetical protein VF624_05735 [Tepidisphaeraceae bacterium]|jgi:hypothetical protein